MITHYLVPGTSFDTWHLIWYLVPHLVPGSSSQILKLASRYLISDFEGGSLLRIEPVSSILFRRDPSTKIQNCTRHPGAEEEGGRRLWVRRREWKRRPSFCNSWPHCLRRWWALNICRWGYDWRMNDVIKQDSFELNDEDDKDEGEFFWMDFDLWINSTQLHSRNMISRCRQNVGWWCHVMICMTKWQWSEWIQNSKNMISLCRKSSASWLPTNYPESCHEGIFIMNQHCHPNLFNIINIANIGIVIFTSRIAILSSPGGRKGSTCCAGVRSFGKPEADNHVDQGHDAHRPEGQPETEPDEAR